MRDHFVAPAKPAVHLVIVSLRRVGTVVGFLFGLGLLALISAGQASAADRSTSDTDGPVGLSGLVEDLVEPVSPVVESVVRLPTDAATPILRPVLEPVAPVLKPVVDAVAPVAEPLVGPVLSPVTEAVGAEDAVNAPVPSRTERTERTEPATPLIRPVPDTEVASNGHFDVWQADSPVVAVGSRSDNAVSDRSAEPGHPGDRPGFPLGSNGVTGGGTASGGTGGQHGADGTAPTLALPSDVDGLGDRGPPGGDIALSWLAFDDRDHPS
jgi:hypothetical protein